MSDRQKHTQGPLETAFCPRGHNQPHSVAIVGPLPDRLIVAKVFGTEVQALADGRLFAASPEMQDALEAQEAVDAHYESHDCQGIEWCDDYLYLWTVARDLRRAALAKATGGEAN